MSEVKRFRADHRHVVETEFDDAQFVGVADFDRVTAERDALQAALDAKDQRVDELGGCCGRFKNSPSSGFGFHLRWRYQIIDTLKPATKPHPCCGSCPAGCTVGAKP